jgi:hypothetical protein
MTDFVVRPFVAEMPLPFPDESLVGYFSRALTRTMIVNLKRGLALANVCPAGSTSSTNIVDRHVDGLATLFGIDRDEISRRLYRLGHFDHADLETIDFFGTAIRRQYYETMFRRVSPRALSQSPHHRAIWDLRPFCFDVATRERLLDVCPVCKSRLRWTLVRGPTKCEVCIDDRGRAKTDLRDHPQPLVEINDETSINFVTGLVDIDPGGREKARKSLPTALSEVSNSDVFEAVMAVASCLRPEVAGQTIAVGRPLRTKDFEGFGPELLEIAGRMIIGGEAGFAAGTAILRANMQERSKAHGFFAEVGPLAGIVVDPSLTPIVKAFFVRCFERDFDDTGGLGLVRRRHGPVRPTAGGLWLNMQEANELFGLSKHVLQRLASTGLVETRRADTEMSPVLMSRDQIAPYAAMYKDAIDEGRARALLRLSAAEIVELVDRGIVEKYGEPVTSMMEGRVSYRGSSVRAVVMAITERASPADPSRSVKDHLFMAARRLPAPVPWPAIIALILSGDIQVELLRKDEREWRKRVAPVDIAVFERLVRLEQAERPPIKSVWVTRSHASQMLNIAEYSMRKVSDAGLLDGKRDGRSTVYKRADVEAAARKYVFLPEMLERSPFRAPHEVGRWLRSVGIEPLAEWSKAIFPIYDRAQFERALPTMPTAIENIKIETRPSKRVSTDVKRKAVAEVKTGLSPYFVARRLGVGSKAVYAWVAHFDEHGDVRPAGKLEGFEDYIVSALDADPTVSIHAFWQEFKKEKANVGYGILSKFIADLGYARDAEGRLIRRI